MTNQEQSRLSSLKHYRKNKDKINESRKAVKSFSNLMAELAENKVRNEASFLLEFKTTNKLGVDNKALAKMYRDISDNLLDETQSQLTKNSTKKLVSKIMLERLGAK
ncbi:hypothetical protein E2R68_02315 [Psychromonas sp. RZ22]|uniref:hypothetical protein n=1 Tax=Psychromonas algarum TaxID=2555643 RepID=UPI0010685978|nr:hypothetical protein [Psychromonas sp. RZ22]TEW55946.1 hypothetical protein E2R68_02315 [Psychromonas sp. RZ22]